MIVKLMNEFTKFYYYFPFVGVGENQVKDHWRKKIDHHLIFFRFEIQTK